MVTLRQPEACEDFQRTGVRIGRPDLWQFDCLDKPGFFGQGAAVAENWQAEVPALLSNLTATLQARWKDAIRMEGIEREVLTLKENVAELRRGCPTVVPIDTLAPEPLGVVHAFHVTVEPYENEYRASFLDANLSAFGETRNEAVWNLKDIIAASFGMLIDVGDEKLGPGPARQLKVLQEFIRKP